MVVVRTLLGPPLQSSPVPAAPWELAREELEQEELEQSLYRAGSQVGLVRAIKTSNKSRAWHVSPGQSGSLAVSRNHAPLCVLLGRG